MKVKAFNLGFHLKRRLSIMLWPIYLSLDDRGHTIIIKLLRVMKLIMVIMTTCLLQVSATGLAQKITLTERNISLEKVLKKIKAQSGFDILYVDNQLNKASKISVDFDQLDLLEALNTIFKDQPLSYEIKEKTIIVKQRKMTLAEQLAAALKNIDVRGKVFGEGDRPLAGATIKVIGSGKTTITNENGEFEFKSIPENASLQISYLGYETLTIAVNSRRQISVKLTSEDEKLEELVVVGYGRTKKADMVSSVSSVSGKELNKFKTANAAMALQGQLPGVRVLQSSGGPGAQPRIYIRGINTLGSTNPLLIVDGAPIASGFFNSINPADIERIDVLKDASSAAIYGANSANGVILVTTKKGKAGQSALTFDLNYQLQQLSKPFEMASSDEYLQLMKLRNPSFVPDLSAERGLDITRSTDWWNEMLNENTPITNAALNYAGGSEKAKYAASFSFLDQQSQAKVGHWKRATGRFNGDFQINKWLKFGGSLAPRYETWINTPADFLGLLSTDPLTPVRRAPGLIHIPEALRPNFDEEFSGYGFPVGGAPNTITNYVYNMNLAKLDKDDLYGIQTSAFVEVNIFKDLTFRSQLSANVDNYTTSTFRPRSYIALTYQSPLTSAGTEFRTDYNWIFFNTLNYQKSLGKHNITALVGQEAQEIKGYYGSSMRYSNSSDNNEMFRYTDFLVEDLNATDVRTALQNNLPTGGINRNAWTKMASYFARVEYNFAGKYYLTSSIRRDGNSRFPVNEQYAVFPSASAGWKISSERFLQDVAWVDNLMVKLRYGKRGNFNNINRLSKVNVISTGYLSPVSGQNTFGIVPGQQGNENLSWETDQDAGLGIEGSFFGNKLTVEFDYFNNKTINTLLNMPIVPSQVLANNTVLPTNIGTISNKGWEFTLGYNSHIGTFNYEARAILGKTKSVFEDLGFEGFLDIGSNDFYRELERFGALSRMTPGGVVGAFYGYKVLGIFQNQKQIDEYVDQNGAKLMPTAKPGDFIYGKYANDGQPVNNTDKTYLGNPYPKLSADLQFKLSYRQVDLLIDLYGSYGHDIYNSTKRYLLLGDKNSNVIAGTYDRTWKGEGTSSEIPNPAGSVINNSYSNSWFIEKGDFTRIRNIAIGYNLPASIFGYIKAPRLTVGIQNVHTFTKYTGINPEVQSNSQIYQGIDRGQYPLPRIFTFGASFSL